MGTVGRLAVMGDREFSCEETVGYILARVILAETNPAYEAHYSDILLVLGGAHGVDQTAREWAHKVNNSYVLFKPPFMVDSSREHSPGDFRVRRKQMVDNCDVLVVIKKPGDLTFDGYIRRAMKLGKTVIIEEIQDAT